MYLGATRAKLFSLGIATPGQPLDTPLIRCVWEDIYTTPAMLPRLLDFPIDIRILL